MKEAMKAKEAVKLATVRAMLSAFMNEAVVLGKTPQDMLEDDQALAVIRRLSKQRKDSIEQFRAGGREDLVGPEQEELTILEAYLPQMMSREAIKAIAETKKAELGICDKSQAGTFMKTLMQELKGQADGGDVKAVVDELLG